MDWRNLETVQAASPCVATIGFFDGVHRGHQFLIGQVVERSKEQQATERSAALRSLVITFDRHPQQVVQPDFCPELLTTLDEKRQQLAKTGIDACCILPFDHEMATLSAHDFMEQVLRNRLNVRELIIGYDNRFGHRRTEGFDDYVRYGRELGIKVSRSVEFEMWDATCPTPHIPHTHLSSSLIRQSIKAGDMEQAARCLGYPYTLTGQVTTGFQEGRKLGFPTANLDIAGTGKLIPAPGAYAVTACVEGSTEQWQAMMNIGTRPTFHGDHLTLEAHLFHFEGDLYGKRLSVSFVSRIREERKFDNAEALTAQLREDRKAAEQKLEENKNIHKTNK